MTNNENRNHVAAIKDPNTKKLIFNKKLVLQTTLEYTSCGLQKNNPEKEFICIGIPIKNVEGGPGSTKILPYPPLFL